MKIRFFFCVRTTAAEGGESMADAYDEMERLMKEYEALAQSDLPPGYARLAETIRTGMKG